MIAGFAMVAYPDVYGESGVMTFMVSHQGKIYESDLGADTGTMGEQISTFDPATGWNIVTP